jgi:hypothetical protein
MKSDVGGAAGLENLVAAAADRQALGIETALGTDRHDDGILDLLRLDQAEHLGAVILRTDPTSATRRARRAEPQMNALDFRTIDKDLPERSRFGKPSSFFGSSLKASAGRGAPSTPVWK